jgi:hypothetical protein
VHRECDNEENYTDILSKYFILLIDATITTILVSRSRDSDQITTAVELVDPLLHIASIRKSSLFVDYLVIFVTIKHL